MQDQIGQGGLNRICVEAREVPSELGNNSTPKKQRRGPKSFIENSDFMKAINWSINNRDEPNIAMSLTYIRRTKILLPNL